MKIRKNHNLSIVALFLTTNLPAYSAIGDPKFLPFILPGGSDSSPAILAGGKILVGANDGKLYLIDPAGVPNGGALNSSSFNSVSFAGGPIHSSPVVNSSGTRAYFGTDGGTLMAVSISGLTMSHLWHHQAKANALLTRSSPAINVTGDTVYYTAQDGFLYAVSTTTGQARWELNLNAVLNQSDGHRLISSPIIGSDGTLYVQGSDGAGSGKIFSISDANISGVIKWSMTLAGIDHPRLSASSPAIGPDGTIYVSAVDKFCGINPVSGQEIFSATIDPGATVTGTPVISQNGNCYVASPTGSGGWVLPRQKNI